MRGNTSTRLVCRWNRLWPSFIVVVSGALLWICLDPLILGSFKRADQWWHYLICGGFALLMGLVLWLGVRQLIHPMVMLEVDAQGLTKYYADSESRQRRPFYIPWARVQGLSYVTGTALSAGRRTKMYAVRVAVDTSDGFEVLAAATDYLPGDFAGDYLLIDTVNPSPGGRKLFRQLELWFQRYGS